MKASVNKKDCFISRAIIYKLDPEGAGEPFASS
jgi:hypothetical protein